MFFIYCCAFVFAGGQYKLKIMKRVTAYKCEFCNKLLNSYSGMKSHEDKCFKNPKSKSCITCKNFDFIPILNGKQLTPNEVEILEFKQEGTYTLEWDRDPEGDGMEYPVLKEQFKYLYEAENENFCYSNCKTLLKLKTQCDLWVGK